MSKYKILGRPKKYKTEKEFRDKVNEYFDSCDNEKEPYTMNGLGLFIGLDRHQLLYYKQDKRFYLIIKEAIQRITYDLEKRAILHGNSAGPIFLLKNMGYSDRHQHELTGKNGQDLKWRIEVVRGRSDSWNGPSACIGAAGPKLVTDNTKPRAGDIEPDQEKAGVNTAILLPGVVNFSKSNK